ILNNIGQGLLMVDKDLVIEAFNPRFRSMFQLTDEMVEAGIPFRDYLERFYRSSTQSRESIERIMAFASRPDAAIYEIEDPDGGIVELRQKPRPGGGWVRVYTDITERKRTEKRLADQMQIARGTLESMDQGMIMVDKELTIVAFNSQFRRLFGVPESAIE